MVGHVSIMDITYHHHLENLWRETICRETGEAMEKWTRWVLDGHHLAEDNTKQADVEMVRWGFRPNTG